MREQKLQQKLTARLAIATLISTLIILSGIFTTVQASSMQSERDRLTEDLQRGYDLMLEAFEDGTMSADHQEGDVLINLSSANISVDSYIFDAWGAIFDDHPEYDYIEWSNISAWSNSSIYTKITLKSSTTNARIEPYQDIDIFNSEINAMNSKIDFLVAEAKKRDTKYEQLKYVHDWIATNNEYNSYVADNNGSLASKKAWFASSAFLSNNSPEDGPVCEGYAESFKIICNRLNIPCVLISGMNHEWNAVMLDGKWYGVDITWDDPVWSGGTHKYDYVRYDYFLVGKNTPTQYGKTFGTDHIAYDGEQYIVISDEAFDPNADTDTLAEAKTAKLAEIDKLYNTYDKADYRTDEWADLKIIFNNAKATVNNATDIAVVNAVEIANLKSQADAIKTDAELTGEETAQALATAKAKANADIDGIRGSYLDSEYRNAQVAELNNIVAAAKVSVDNASTVKAVEEIVDGLDSKLDKIKTDAELKAEEGTQDLAVAKANKLAEIERVFGEYSESDYREAQWKSIVAIFNNAREVVNSAVLVSHVNGLNIAHLKVNVDAIKTDKELTDAENASALSAAKAKKVAEINNAFATYKQADYRTAQWAELKVIFDGAKATVNSADDIAKVNAVNVAILKAQADKIKTDEELSEEEEVKVPDVPKIRKTEVDGTVLKIDWKEVKYATRYKVACYNYTTKKWSYYETSNTDFNIRTAVGGGKYEVRVASLYRKDGKEVRTDYSKGELITVTLDVPELTYAGFGDSATEIRVKWKAVRGATSYRVGIYNKDDDKWNFYNTSKLTLDIRTSAGGESYIVKVKAINKTVESAYTSNKDALKVRTPKAPKITKAKADDLKLKIDWKKAKGADKYKVGVYNYAIGKWSYYETSDTDLEIKTRVGGRKYKVVVSSLVKNDNGRYVSTGYNNKDAKYITTKK